jgi:hypothetical protein
MTDTYPERQCVRDSEAGDVLLPQRLEVDRQADPAASARLASASSAADGRE